MSKRAVLAVGCLLVPVLAGCKPESDRVAAASTNPSSTRPGEPLDQMANGELPTPPAPDHRVGAYFFGPPSELQFSCAFIGHYEEEKLATDLAGGDDTLRLPAAQELWRKHSRRHASAVLDYVQSSPRSDPLFRAFQHAVQGDLRPTAILREHEHGHRQWARWLATLRPHPDLVEPFLHDLSTALTDQEEIVVALGKSRDQRALEPLCRQLTGNDDNIVVGFTARALGDLGHADAEDALIAAIGRDDSSWIQANAATALGKIGTIKAIPALEAIAKDRSYAGAINRSAAAEHAIEQIRVRLTK